MNSVTFAGLCKDYAQLIERITRIETLPAGYWQQEDEQELDRLYARRDELKQQLRAGLEQPHDD